MKMIKVATVVAAMVVSCHVWAQNTSSSQQPQSTQSAKDIGGVSDTSVTSAGSLSSLDRSYSSPGDSTRSSEMRMQSDTFRHH
ncbi:hypothetical protein AWB80_05698 [Caballeronia pedi]|uniref:Lipoprotein n=1 Tax=Caballeronia pedi TaxID=1777141 RepID=A0A158CTH7_9BURK|nr:hypothetical protein [Caballeronia pedi]SAK84867.1 hypothetical protein AWB80_05698 [Caballeronia pedi]